MKRICLILLITSMAMISQSQNTDLDLDTRSDANFYELQDQANQYFNQQLKSAENDNLPRRDKKYHRFKRWEWFWKNRINPDGSFPNLAEKHRAFLEENTPLKSAQNINDIYDWTNINQKTCTGGYNGMGRTTAIAFHPSNPDIFYVGAPVGGIWKTTDGGLSYTPMGDNLPHVGVGSIAIDSENPGTIYISLADNSGWWNYSLGIYKSTNGGETWQATNLSFDFSEGIAIYSMVMNPNNPKHLVVGTSAGLFQTLNGGCCWEKLKPASWNDVKFSPDGEYIYAAKFDPKNYSQIFRADNSGENWVQVSNFSVNNTKIKLAVTPANPHMLAALSSADKQIYISKNRGTNLHPKSKATESRFLYVSPHNENIIYHGYVSIYQSKDGGNSSSQITMWHSGTALAEVHADQQFALHNPLTGYIYFCNDGGVYRYHEGNNIWDEFSNGLVITQYYKLAVAQTDPVFLIGGTQDNGGRKRNSDGSWTPTNGGDAMEVAVDPTNENIFYSSYCNGELYRTINGWQTHTCISDNIPGKPTGSWVTPYVLDPQNPATIVAGYADVYRSGNRGNTWTKISSNLTGNAEKFLHCIAVAPSNSAAIFASSNNTLYKTTNLGESWEETLIQNSKQNITSILVQKASTDTLWVSFGGYQGKKVFKSVDAGKTWNDQTLNLPDVPVNVLINDTTQNFNLIYAGTDMGVYFKNDTMQQWNYFGTGLPNTSVTDMDIQYNTRKLRVATYGRGVWETRLHSETHNTSPQVSIQTPEDNLRISTGDRVTLTAIASDPDGEIEKVAFFNGSIKLGEKNTPPYELHLNAMPSGNYRLFARAIDNRGSIGESDCISMIVECPEDGKLSGEVIGSSSACGSLATKEKAFDGNTTTYFEASKSCATWVGYAFDENQMIQGIRYFPRNGLQQKMVGGKFQGCNSPDFDDNVTTLYEIKNQPELDWNCLNISHDQTFKYVRYLSPSGSYCNVSEIEFFGTYTTAANQFESENTSVVYPNPFRNEVNIEHTFTAAKVTVCNSAGIVIPCRTETTPYSTRVTFPNDCRNGLYILTLQSGSEVFVHKIIKTD